MQDDLEDLQRNRAYCIDNCPKELALSRVLSGYLSANDAALFAQYMGTLSFHSLALHKVRVVKYLLFHCFTPMVVTIRFVVGIQKDAGATLLKWLIARPANFGVFEVVCAGYDQEIVEALSPQLSWRRL